MTALLTEPRSRHVRVAPQSSLFAEGCVPPLEAVPSLDDVVSRRWESLAAAVASACPICSGELAPELGGGGRCGSCGTTLS